MCGIRKYGWGWKHSRVAPEALQCCNVAVVTGCKTPGLKTTHHRIREFSANEAEEGIKVLSVRHLENQKIVLLFDLG